MALREARPPTGEGAPTFAAEAPPEEADVHRGRVGGCRPRQKEGLHHAPTRFCHPRRTVTPVLDHAIDWAAYDAAASSVHPRARRWVERRVASALGADDAALVDHVMGLVAEHASGARVAAELAPVLDDDAVPFAVGLVRLLILETTKAKEGLTT